MRAAIVTRYGPPEVVEIQERPTPAPGPGEVLVRGIATTVNSGDSRIRGVRVPKGMAWGMRLKLGLTKPRNPILGFEVAGEVESVGEGVTAFEAGDRVVASRGFDLGCHAEYVTVAADGAIAPIPEACRAEDAVSVLFGGLTTLDFFDKGKVVTGESILVNGASGAVGTMAVQIAKHLGLEVTAVCSAANAGTVKDLGADHVVDYATTDITAEGTTYDVIMDNHGTAPYSRVKGLLKPGGRVLMVVGDLWQNVEAARRADVVASTGNSPEFTADAYRRLLSLLEHGVLRPVIDTTLPFDEIVEAHRRVDTIRKVGSVVLTF